MLCSCLVNEDGYLCSDCWAKINFISKPYCNICSFPLDSSEMTDVSCISCVYKRPPYERLLAVMQYDDASRKLITRFKYSDKTHYSKTLGKWMFNNGKSLIEESDYLVPVPLHKLRLLSRKYNQSALLCNVISKHSETPVIYDCLLRDVNTKPQAGMNKNKRLNNVSNAFKINKSHIERIHSKNVILVDDVITTGATIDACCKVLYNAGAKHVYVLVVAKTVNK